jgi:hypothetical protein
MYNPKQQPTMKKFITLTFLLFTLSTLCHAFNFETIETNTWNDFEGTLGKGRIQLSLYRLDNGQLKGSYCYKKYESKIQLTGQITGDKIVITEFLNGKPNGRFEGKVFTDKLDRFEGTWTDNSNTKSIEFKLTLQSTCGSDFGHRYSDFYGTDDDVEKFMKHVKTSILNSDKEWIANHINYPLKTTLFKGKAITIKNKKQLIDNFDQIFHQEFKDKIKSLCVCNMFNNYQGVMLGDGQIWINNRPNSTDDTFNYIITAIFNEGQI